MVGRATSVFFHRQLWLVKQPFCLSWTFLVDKATGFICYGQFWLVEQPILSGMLLLIGPYYHIAHFMSYRAG